jgi:hypothetical protein
MTLLKVTEFYAEWFIIFPSMTSKFHTITMLKALSNKNDSSRTYRYVHDPLLYQTPFVKEQQFIGCFLKTEYEF